MAEDHVMRGRRRIWCELLSYRELKQPRLLSLLAARDIELLFAVMPQQAPRASSVVRACRDAGVSCGVWPLLEVARGRWANELTGDEMAAFGVRLLDRLADERGLPDELAVDLEPPYELMARPGVRAIARFAVARFARGGFAAPVQRLGGAESLRRLTRHARSLGVSVTVATMPMALQPHNGTRWQSLLATPIDRLLYDHVSLMIYTSLIEGYSRGVLRRRDAAAILAAFATMVQSRPHLGISLGAVGRGSLGDEPTYRHVGELAADVAIARAAGIDDLALFSLCGVRARPPPEAWLDAFVATEPAAELPDSLRARVAFALLTGRRLHA